MNIDAEGLKILAIRDLVYGSDGERGSVPHTRPVPELDRDVAELMSGLALLRRTNSEAHRSHAHEVGAEQWVALLGFEIGRGASGDVARLAHLADSCPICRADLAEMRLNLKMVREAEEAVPQEVLERYREGHRAEPGVFQGIVGILHRIWASITRGWPPLVWPAAVAAGAALVFFVIANPSDKPTAPGVEYFGAVPSANIAVAAQVFTVTEGGRVRQVAMLRDTDRVTRTCPGGAGLRITVEPLGEGHLNLWMIDQGGYASHIESLLSRRFSGVEYVFPMGLDGEAGPDGGPFIWLSHEAGDVELLVTLSSETPPGMAAEGGSSFERFLERLFGEEGDEPQPVSGATLEWLREIRRGNSDVQVQRVQCRVP